MNRYMKHGHYYETSANCLLPNLTQFLPRGAGAMLLILSGLSGVLKTTSAEDGKTPLPQAIAGNENSTVITALSKATNRCDCSYGSLGGRGHRCGLHLARQKTELNHFIGSPKSISKSTLLRSRMRQPSKEQVRKSFTKC